MTQTPDGFRGTDDAPLQDALSPFSRSVMREVAHLLRSPLGSIVMLADTMRTSTSEPLSEAQRQKLGIIHRAALGAAATMGDLLVLTGHEEELARTRDFSILGLVEAVADVVRPVTEARGCELMVSVDETRREGASSGLSRVLLGLALLGASRVRDGTVEISAAPKDGDTVAFAIVATGTPAAPDDEPAELLRALRRDPTSGSLSISPDGLRLSGARELLRRMGSELVVAEEDGTLGLSFYLGLPPAV